MGTNQIPSGNQNIKTKHVVPWFSHWELLLVIQCGKLSSHAWWHRSVLTNLTFTSHSICHQLYFHYTTSSIDSYLDIPIPHLTFTIFPYFGSFHFPWFVAISHHSIPSPSRVRPGHWSTFARFCFFAKGSSAGSVFGSSRGMGSGMGNISWDLLDGGMGKGWIVLLKRKLTYIYIFIVQDPKKLEVPSIFLKAYI